MTASRPDNEHLTPDPLRELLGSEEIQQAPAAFKARLRSQLVTAPPTPTGWGLKLPGGQQLAPATSAMAMVLLVSFTALAAYFFSDTVLPTVMPEAEMDAPVLVEPDLEAPPEGAPASDQPADGASRGDAAREAPGGPGVGSSLDTEDQTDLEAEDAAGDSGTDTSAPGSAPGNNPVVAPPVAPASTPEAPAPPAEEPVAPPDPVREEPEEPKEPRKQPTDPPIAPTDEPEATVPQPTPTNYVAPGRETRPPLPSPTPEPTATPTEAPPLILPIDPVNAG